MGRRIAFPCDKVHVFASWCLISQYWFDFVFFRVFYDFRGRFWKVLAMDGVGSKFPLQLYSLIFRTSLSTIRGYSDHPESYPTLGPTSHSSEYVGCLRSPSDLFSTHSELVSHHTTIPVHVPKAHWYVFPCLCGLSDYFTYVRYLFPPIPHGPRPTRSLLHVHSD